jgi:undecaprenyl diphosphate synthase
VVLETPVRGVAHDQATPVHVAIIMDGNGRWAKMRGQSRHAGHRAGTENIRRVIRAFAERGVQYLTLYAFSTENWTRPRAEIRSLMRILAFAIAKEVQALHRNNVRLLHIGDLSALSGALQKQVRDAIELTRDNTGLTLVLAFNYGGRAELVQAVREIVASGVDPKAVDEDLIARHLYTSGIPDPDLVVRTAGEMRLSNFLVWQTAYAEYYSTPACWPDFDVDEVARALDAFAGRRRRYGGLLADEADRLV